MNTLPGSSVADLQARLPDLMLRDRHRLQRRLGGARKVRDPKRRQSIAAEIEADVADGEQRIARRRAGVPTPRYPDELPVSQHKDEILEAARDHQVVIVAGETGSGKTTQLPKVCLELGRGVHGLIGHTQPRRLAARTVAERVAEELDTPLGETVGYKVRFTDKSQDDTLVKQMTDGILLAEIQHDRELRQYDTLIIDEAHERSLNIDFILGYVKQLLPRRPDLRVIITSATIDPDRFSRHFGDAPVIEVSGRTYPVEVRYRPIAGDQDERDRDQTQAICDAADELRHAGQGDILVFCSGEREIRDTADALQKRKYDDTEVLPLYARLSAADQHRVFQRHRARRIVLATNIAETSLTVPGIKYVIDPGTARISRYSHRTKVQRLPIEPISQASANQRKGRCGRVSEGICIRLYSEDDFLSRPEFTDPEILRTNLASVILQMAAAGLGEIESFPFIDPPDRRQIKAGMDLLHELGALDADTKNERGRLTSLGRKLARLPVDPRLARMVLEAGENGCAREVMVIAAAMSIQDPRERPAEARQAADEKHARFADKESDFLSYLNLWHYVRQQREALSSNQFRKLCGTEYLNYPRIREWQDVYGQLRQLAKPLGITPNDAPADPKQVHIALLAGLLSHIGVMDTEKREYRGARGTRFAVFPGSALAKKPPRWVVAGELMETSRLWGRIAAKIEPEWVEPLAKHLVKRDYSEPHWEKNQGAAIAYEKVTLYGVPIVSSRKVNYGRIDPELSRELFIRHALVEGDWETHHQFFHDNRRLLDEVQGLEDRARRRDIVVDDETLFDFYDQRIGSDVVSARHFDSWWKKVRRTQPALLNFSTSLVMRDDAAGVDEGDYPDSWQQDNLRLDLSYHFEPGADADGVTCHIPLAVLNQVTGEGVDWQVPGLREELVAALIRSLPKALRRNFVPAPNYAKAALDRMAPGQESLLDALERELHRMGGVDVRREDWQLDKVPNHLKMTYQVVDDKGAALDEDRDIDALKGRLKPRLRATVSAAADGIEREGLSDWSVGTLPATVEQGRGGHTVKAYPALVDEGDTVAVRMFDTEADQREAMWRGTRRLLLLNAPSASAMVRGRLDNQAKLALGHSPHGDVAALLDDCLACAADDLIAQQGGPAWDEEGFGKLLDAVRGELPDVTVEVVTAVARVLTLWHQLDRRLSGGADRALLPALADVRAQLAALAHPGFVTDTGRLQLSELPRYLRAASHRLDKLPENPERDRARMLEVQRLRESYERLLGAARVDETSAAARRIGWMIEELRVSYFAQQLGTAHPVSEKRIRRAMDELAG